jgi:IAA-amino acid hydrolase
MTSLLDRATGFQRELIELRRDLHRHPELSFRESRTADTAAQAVESLGWRVRRGVGRTGLVAELGGGRPTIALRADMDALPIQEAGDAEYRSTVDGVMHACGHDAHVSMLVGAARLLAEAHEAGQLNGTVRLLFQPSEEASDDEGKSGATRMIEDGAMDGVDAIFGLHIGAHLKLGSGLHLARPDHGRLRPLHRDRQRSQLPRRPAARGYGRHRARGARHPRLPDGPRPAHLAA